MNRAEQLEVIREALEFIADYADVCDGSYGEQRPNKAMQLASDLMAVIVNFELDAKVTP